MARQRTIVVRDRDRQRIDRTDSRRETIQLRDQRAAERREAERREQEWLASPEGQQFQRAQQFQERVVRERGQIDRERQALDDARQRLRDSDEQRAEARRSDWWKQLDSESRAAEIERQRQDREHERARIREANYRLTMQQRLVSRLDRGVDAQLPPEPDFSSFLPSDMRGPAPRRTVSAFQRLEIARAEAAQRGDPLPTGIRRDSTGVTVTSRDVRQEAQTLGIGTDTAAFQLLQRSDPATIRAAIRTQERQQAIVRQREQDEQTRQFVAEQPGLAQTRAQRVRAGERLRVQDFLADAAPTDLLAPGFATAVASAQRFERTEGRVPFAPTTRERLALELGGTPIRQPLVTRTTEQVADVIGTQPRTTQALTRRDRAAMAIFERTEPILDSAQTGARNVLLLYREGQARARETLGRVPVAGPVLSAVATDPIERFRFEFSRRDQTPRAQFLAQAIGSGQAFITESPVSIGRAARNVPVFALAALPGTAAGRDARRVGREGFRDVWEGALPFERDPETGARQFTPERVAGTVLLGVGVVAGGVGAGFVALSRTRSIPQTRPGTAREQWQIVQQDAVTRGIGLPDGIPTGARVIGTRIEQTRGIPRFTGRPAVQTQFFQDFSGRQVVVRRSGRVTDEITFDAAGGPGTLQRFFDGRPTGRARPVAAPPAGAVIPEGLFFQDAATFSPVQAVDRTGTFIAEARQTARAPRQVSLIDRRGPTYIERLTGRVRSVEQFQEFAFVPAREFATAPFQQIAIVRPTGRRVVGRAPTGEPTLTRGPTGTRRARSLDDVPEFLTAETPITATGNVFDFAVSPPPQTRQLLLRRRILTAELRATRQRRPLSDFGIRIEGPPQGVLFSLPIPVPAAPRSLAPPRTRTRSPADVPVARLPTQLALQRVRRPTLQRPATRTRIAPTLAFAQRSTPVQALDMRTPLATLPATRLRVRTAQQPRLRQTQIQALTAQFAGATAITAPLPQLSPQLVPPPSTRRTPRRPTRRIPRPFPFIWPGGSAGFGPDARGSGRRDFLRTPSLIAVARRDRAPRGAGLSDVTGLRIRGL